MYKVFLIMLFSFLLIWANEEKTSYLPPYEPHSFVSPRVQEFLESNGKSIFEQDSISANHDALGRKNRHNSRQKYRPFVLRQSKMDVFVHFLNIIEKEEDAINAEYQYENGIRYYWLNGNPISETDYFNSILGNRSYYAPDYTASLTVDDINSLLNGSIPVYISEITDDVDAAAYSKILDTTTVSTWAFSNGYNGSGIGVYIAENGCPNASIINTSNFVQSGSCIEGVTSHATGLTRVFQSTAPNATLFQVTRSETPNISSLNPQVEIGIHSYSGSGNSSYNPNDAYLDDFIYNNDIISFVAAGNQTSSSSSSYVTTPGKALNAITVGAVLPFTNNYETNSLWENPQIGYQKPEIATYDYFYFPNDAYFVDDNGETYNGTVQGTSAATAFSAGVMADVLHQHPFFKHHPELAKALMITASTKPIGNADSYDQDNATVAARGIPLYKNLGWNTRSRYWRGSNSCCFIGDSIVFTESNIVSGKRYRIAIAWLIFGSYVLSNNNISQDIDLYVYQDGALVAFSYSAKNPFEAVDFYANSNSDLKIRIVRYANSGTGIVALGYNMWFE